jgi:[histone H3]-lysine4 N-trimethyltransferase ASH1L
VTKPETVTTSSENYDDCWPSCDCELGKGCGDDCMNRQLFIECKLGQCQGGYGLPDEKGGCGNTACQTRTLFPETEVYLTPWCGWGLRMKENVKKGRPIIEYCGEVITTEMCRERLGNLEKGDDFYFASLTSSLVLDAAGQGSNARFANHSCNPNCVMEKWLVGGEPRVVLLYRYGYGI